jgi:hypothetical protein
MIDNDCQLFLIWLQDSHLLLIFHFRIRQSIPFVWLDGNGMGTVKIHIYFISIQSNSFITCYKVIRNQTYYMELVRVNSKQLPYCQQSIKLIILNHSKTIQTIHNHSQPLRIIQCHYKFLLTAVATQSSLLLHTVLIACNNESQSNQTN